MTIPLYGSAGALFNRLGKLGLAIKNVNSFQTTLETTLIDLVNGIIAQYTTEPDLAAEIGNTYIGLLGSLESPCSVMQTLAADTINRMVYRDNPRVNQNLTSSNLNASIAEVIRQMNAAGATILQQTVTNNTPSSFTGTGNGAVVVSVKRPFDGRLLENLFAETLLFTCSADSYVGGATLNNEQFTVTGEGSEGDVFAFDWPLGSNAISTINAIDGNADSSSGNILTNSGFTEWSTLTPNVPTGWTIAVGSAGTNVFKETTLVYGDGPALRLSGSGLTSLVQAIPSSSISPQAQYAFNIWLRSGPSGTGILQFDLIDQNGNIIQDQAGVNNSFTVNVASLGVNYTAFNGVFRTPEALPSSVSMRIHLTTALSGGCNVYLDRGSLGAMTQLYVGGPFVSVHSGSVPFVSSPVGDYATCIVNNPRGAGGTLNTFQTLLWRLLTTVQTNEILFPSSSTPSISDSLIG